MKSKESYPTIEELISTLIAEKEHWKKTRDCGCNDPFWCDGVNMNLVRNHIIYYKNMITDLCSSQNIALPAEYFIPTPPEVNPHYMAPQKDKSREKRLRQMGNKFTRVCPEYYEEQLCLF